VVLSASACVEYARAPAAPTCFKKERLETASIVIFFSPYSVTADSFMPRH
jgi:hypothetical protein